MNNSLNFKKLLILNKFKMKAIQEELGGSGSFKEIEELRKQSLQKKWSKTRIQYLL